MPLIWTPPIKQLKTRLPSHSKTTVTEAAFGIHDLINETMAAAAKTHIAEKGGNPIVSQWLPSVAPDQYTLTGLLVR